ncbi:hypothetical protein PHABIO_426 [Pseudomonas phage Phabio]|uniref:Uncharacterized protein n=1 Tax=Pseudomonas phage Phabio TaxID=2006668 RepID=A0A1Y0T2H1_9CAUD|nr:hypothetical protein MZD05_gp426 [Pseudomonas phage Phabio]ARV77057.1 hypothetical protein PHABIO_426 [Pseudomonas phage Phabio]
MTTEINKEYEAAVAGGYTGTRSEYIASKKKKRDYFNEGLNLLILSGVITLLFSVVGSAFVEHYIDKTSTKLEYWAIVNFSVLVGLLGAHNVFKRKDA